MDDSGLREQFMIAGRATVERSFSSDAGAEALAKVLRRVVQGAAHRRRG